jgi:hypothetical protein
VRVGDIAALAERLDATFCAGTERRLDGVERERLMRNHDWRQIARQTLEVYIAALPEGRGVSHRPGAVTQPSKAVFGISAESTPLHR